MSTGNVALDYLNETDDELPAWNGWCFDLTDVVGQWLDKKGVRYHRVWIDLLNYRWKYHAAVVIDGMAHDPWFPEVVPVAVWLTHFIRHLERVEYIYEEGPIEAFLERVPE
jgi:hypothetical protein